MGWGKGGPKGEARHGGNEEEGEESARDREGWLLPARAKKHESD